MVKSKSSIVVNPVTHAQSKAIKLEELPSNVLMEILTSILESDSSLTEYLIRSFGSHISNATYTALLYRITINDVDSLDFLQYILINKPELLEKVRHATVVQNEYGQSITDLDVHSAHSMAQPSLQDVKTPSTSGEDLLIKLVQLTSFTWQSNQLPPAHLIHLLPQTLTSFKLDLSPSTAITTSSSDHHHSPGPEIDQIKWDAHHLSALSPSLINLSISHLSVEGAKRLSNALEMSSFPALERIELSRTRYIDDHVMVALAEGCKKLKTLKISEMQGTKLTDAGLIKVFENESIEELVLDQVEGRLSKTFWKKLIPLPESFKSIAITFPEHGPHHSWVADHLESFALVCATPTLKSISVNRQIREQSIVDPSTSESVTSKPIPAKILAALVERDDDRLETIEVDYWEVSLDNFKSIMEKNVGLVQLQVLLSEPFKSILTLASSFALTIHLRSLIVSINSRQHHLQVYASPRSMDLTSSSPKSKSMLASDGDMLPPLRDWRRLLKKSQRLEQIVWTGRGGLGRYVVNRGGSGSTVRVEFEPIFHTRQASVEEGEADDDGTSSISSPCSLSSPARRRNSSRRRASSVSLTGSMSLFEFSSSIDSPGSSPSEYSGLGIDTISTSPTTTGSSSASPILSSRTKRHPAATDKRVTPSTTTKGVPIPLTPSQKSALLLELEKERLEKEHLERFPRLSPNVSTSPIASFKDKGGKRSGDNKDGRNGNGNGNQEGKKSASGASSVNGNGGRRGSSGGLTSSFVDSGKQGRRNSAVESTDGKVAAAKNIRK